MFLAQNCRRIAGPQMASRKIGDAEWVIGRGEQQAGPRNCENGTQNCGALPMARGDAVRGFCVRPRSPWSEHQRALGSWSKERWSSLGKSNGAVRRKAPAKRGREYYATAFHYITAARQPYTGILLRYVSAFPFASRRSSPVLCPRSSVLSTEPHRPLCPTTANLGHINNLHLRLIVYYVCSLIVNSLAIKKNQLLCSNPTNMKCNSQLKSQ